jgi:hypothetical protein
MLNLIPDRDRDLSSVGRLAELLQASPGQIERAAAAAGIEVTIRIDGRPYFSDAQIPTIRDVLKRPEPRA